MERHHQKLIGVIEKGKFHLFTYENENKGVEKRYLQKFAFFYILLIPKESFQFQELPKKESLFKISKYIFQTNSDEKKIGKEYCFTKRQTLSPKWKRTLTDRAEN